LFHADGQTDRHDDANSRFSEFCERAKKRKRDRKPPFLNFHSGFLRGKNSERIRKKVTRAVW